MAALGVVLGTSPRKMLLSPPNCETDWSRIRKSTVRKCVCKLRQLLADVLQTPHRGDSRWGVWRTAAKSWRSLKTFFILAYAFLHSWLPDSWPVCFTVWGTKQNFYTSVPRLARLQSSQMKIPGSASVCNLRMRSEAFRTEHTRRLFFVGAICTECSTHSVGAAIRRSRDIDAVLFALSMLSSVPTAAAVLCRLTAWPRPRPRPHRIPWRHGMIAAVDYVIRIFVGITHLFVGRS